MTLLSTILLLISATGLLAVWLGFGSRQIATLCICFGVVAVLTSAGCQEELDSTKSQPGDEREGEPNENQPEDNPKDAPADSGARLEQSVERLKSGGGDMQAFALLQAIPPQFVEERRSWLRSMKQKRPEQAEALQSSTASEPDLHGFEAQSLSHDPREQSAARQSATAFFQQAHGRPDALDSRPDAGPLAVLNDDQVVAAPIVHAELAEAVQISGGFSEAQVALLLKAFNRQHAGRAP